MTNSFKDKLTQIRTNSHVFSRNVTDRFSLQVIYSLNMKNEEQEAALQALSHAHHQELHRILMETCHEGEGSALRTRLLELQESLDEQQRVGAQVCACVSLCVCAFNMSFMR